MSLHLTLYDSPAKAVQIADYSYTTRGLMASTGPHGFEQLHADQQLPLGESFRLYDRPGLPWAILSDGAGVVWEGRLDAAAIRDGSATLGAMGAWQWLTDLPYTALWSDSGTGAWGADNPAGSSSPRYQIDTNNRLYVACQKGATYGNGVDLGVIRYLQPHGGARLIVGGSWDYDITLPANWKVELISASDTYGGGVVVWTLTASGANQTGTINTTWTGAEMVYLRVYNATGAGSTPAGETGANYAKLTNVRLVTSTANRVSTSWSSPAGPVTGVQTVTPASMANIYVGQRLSIKQGGATNAESVIVTAVTSTTFTATFAGTHVAAETITAHVVYADEIVKDCLADIVAVNMGLSSNTTLIQSPLVDLTDQVFEDANMGAVLDTLAAIGDNATPPLRWEVGVGNQQLLYFRPKSSASRVWYVDVAPDGLQIERSLQTLHNSAYTTYQDADGRTLRTATSSDAASVARYGVTRQQAVDSSTTSSTLATTIRDTAIRDGADPPPRSSVVFDGLYDAGGAWWPLYWCKSGDTLIARNLPPTLSTTIDRIRVMRLIQVEYNAGGNTSQDSLRVVPEGLLPDLEFFLVRSGAGVGG